MSPGMWRACSWKSETDKKQGRTHFVFVLFLPGQVWVDNLCGRWYNDMDNLITHCVAVPAAWPVLLNKITGCESRTVPPLYELTGTITGESRSLGNPGKADGSCANALKA